MKDINQFRFIYYPEDVILTILVSDAIPNKEQLKWVREMNEFFTHPLSNYRFTMN